MRSAGSRTRLLQIAWVLLRSVAEGLPKGFWERSWAPPARSLRVALEALGPAFIKLGQFLSVRPDLLPAEAIAELEKLQDGAAAVPLAQVRRVLEEELGAPAERLFRTLDPRPLASASVSQVHRAVLPSGEAVAVKIQRPGVARAIRLDLELAGRLLGGLVRWSPLRGRLDVDALWAEVLQASADELDFRREAEVAESFARSFRAWPRIRVPRIHWAWTSRRVLTAEFIEGSKISDVAARDRQGYAELAELGALAFLKQVLEEGLFHADLHPANLLITPRGEVAYLDFGIVGRLTSEEREAALGTVAGWLCRDGDLALRHMERLGVRVPANAREAFSADVARLLEEALLPRLGDVSLRRIGGGLLEAVRRHSVVFPRKYALLVKGLLTIEGTARALHPGFCFEAAARRYVLEFGRKRLRLATLAEALWRGTALVGLSAICAAEAGRERSA
jgi:ubiquinone biosynthesis protein